MCDKEKNTVGPAGLMNYDTTGIWASNNKAHCNRHCFSRDEYFFRTLRSDFSKNEVAWYFYPELLFGELENNRIGIQNFWDACVARNRSRVTGLRKSLKKQCQKYWTYQAISMAPSSENSGSIIASYTYRSTQAGDQYFSTAGRTATSIVQKQWAFSKLESETRLHKNTVACTRSA